MIINNDDHLLLKDYFNSIFSNNPDGVVENIVELIIRPECNQKCEYCYLTKYGDSLYPHAQRASNEVILKNVQAFFDYLWEKQSYLSRLELFAGDLFYDNLFFDLIEIIYNYYYKIYQIHPNLFNSQHTQNFFYGDKAIIIMPCNCSFCNDKIKIERFKQVVDKLSNINVQFIISYSTDGLHASHIREKHDLSEEFLDNVFTLLYDYDYCSHPMTSYESIDNIIMNYEWWKSQLTKYNNKYNCDDIIIPCMLEVRNEGWTDEAIAKYIEFLNYAVEDRLKLCNNNLEHLAFEAFCRDPKNHDYHRFGTIEMSPIMISFTNTKNTKMCCSLGHSICIQCNNLTLVPCHRLSYQFFHGGKFILDDNNKIIDLKALPGMNGYLNLIHKNPQFGPKCCSCDYQNVCIKGCCGAQFEAMADPNVPIPDVCKLYQEKAKFLIKKYNDLKLYKIAIEKGYVSEQEINDVKYILELIGEKFND